MIFEVKIPKNNIITKVIDLYYAEDFRYKLIQHTRKYNEIYLLSMASPSDGITVTAIIAL